MMSGLFLAKSMIFLLCFLSVLNLIQIVCTHYVILYFREAQSVNNNLTLICGSYISNCLQTFGMTVRFLKHSINSDLTYSSGLNMGIKLILGTSLLLLGLSSLEIPMSNANWPTPGAAPEPNSGSNPGYIKHVSLSTVENNSLANNRGNQVLASNDSVIAKQETFMSELAPVRHPGQPPHEVVFALPLRDDERFGLEEQHLPQASQLK